MLSDFELNIYKALDELVGSEKKFKILETEDILNTTKKFDTTADIAKIPDVIKDFKDKDLIDLKYFTPEEFCLMIKKDLNELIAETNVYKKVVESTIESSPSEKSTEDEIKKEKLKKKELKSDTKNKQLARQVKSNMTLLYSFLGSFFGAIVCGIVFVLLYFFLKR